MLTEYQLFFIANLGQKNVQAGRHGVYDFIDSQLGCGCSPELHQPCQFPPSNC